MFKVHSQCSELSLKDPQKLSTQKNNQHLGICHTGDNKHTSLIKLFHSYNFLRPPTTFWKMRKNRVGWKMEMEEIMEKMEISPISSLKQRVKKKKTFKIKSEEIY